MDMSIAFVSNFQTSERMKPCNRTLDLPTRFTQSAAVGCADLCKYGFDAPLTQAFPMWLGTVASVALNDFWLVQGPTSLASYLGNGINQRVELGNVVAIRPGQDDRERDALCVDDEVVLAAEFAPVRGARAGFFPASTARIDELSTRTRVRSSWPRRRSSANSVSWTRCHTPASCQAARRRQQAVPEPQPISWGSKFHAMPERSTNTMPVSTARSGVGLRPAYRRLRDAGCGRSGSISDHSSSSISSLGIASYQAKQDRKLTPNRKS
jgi:hypothetical protein